VTTDRVHCPSVLRIDPSVNNLLCFDNNRFFETFLKRGGTFRQSRWRARSVDHCSPTFSDWADQKAISFIKRASASRPSGEWSDDDYGVLVGIAQRNPEQALTARFEWGLPWATLFRCGRTIPPCSREVKTTRPRPTLTGAH
jgi:hypothetical protein